MTAVTYEEAVPVLQAVAMAQATEEAGCVAEEIIAVALLDEARGLVAIEGKRGRPTADEAEQAAEELRGLFELFQDDDVLALFGCESQRTLRWQASRPYTGNWGSSISASTLGFGRSGGRSPRAI